MLTFRVFQSTLRLMLQSLRLEMQLFKTLIKLQKITIISTFMSSSITLFFTAKLIMLFSSSFTSQFYIKWHTILNFARDFIFTKINFLMSLLSCHRQNDFNYLVTLQQFFCWTFRVVIKIPRE